MYACTMAGKRICWLINGTHKLIHKCWLIYVCVWQSDKGQLDLCKATFKGVAKQSLMYTSMLAVVTSAYVYAGWLAYMANIRLIRLMYGAYTLGGADIRICLAVG